MPLSFFEKLFFDTIKKQSLKSSSLFDDDLKKELVELERIRAQQAKLIKDLHRQIK